MDHHGYFTMEQARAAGLERHAILMMERRGTIDRVSRGLYFDPLVPVGPLGPYMAASLWPHGVQGTLSHQTALELLGISDADPARIHITLPAGMRVRRKVPGQYVLHNADLAAADMTLVEGIPVTTAARAIRDCHAIHLGPALLRQAIEDGRRTGRLTREQADRLRQEVLGERGEGVTQ